MGPEAMKAGSVTLNGITRSMKRHHESGFDRIRAGTESRAEAEMRAAGRRACEKAGAANCSPKNLRGLPAEGG